MYKLLLNNKLPVILIVVSIIVILLSLGYGNAKHKYLKEIEIIKQEKEAVAKELQLERESIEVYKKLLIKQEVEISRTKQEYESTKQDLQTVLSKEEWSKEDLPDSVKEILNRRTP